MNYLACLFFAFIVGCSLGPEYKRPIIKDISSEFKEGKILWKEAKSSSPSYHDQWWEIYNDELLNNLIEKLNKNNQDIISAYHSYQASISLIDNAKSSYFPDVSSNYSLTRNKEKNTSNKANVNNYHSVGLNSSWELDLWGEVSNNIKANKAFSLAGKANLDNIKLSMQTSLAQYYFMLIIADLNQKLLEKIEKYNYEIVKYYQNRFKVGLAQDWDINNAENQYSSAKIAALDNKILRSKYEHAIAYLVGESPASFSLEKKKSKIDYNIVFPVFLPSDLILRRPDIINSEKLVEQANAEIGVAKTAFFPSFSLGLTSVKEGNGWKNLLDFPSHTWSFGPQIAIGILDGGAKRAQLKNAKSNYEVAVANYRKSVLNAIKEVEDQLLELILTKNQQQVQDKVVENARHNYLVKLNQFNAGIIDQANLINEKINQLNNVKELNEIILQIRISETNLIKALGGGWKI